MGDTGELRERWEAVQASFVDDPQRAVERADEMVSLAVAALQAHVEQRREDLAETWRGGGQASTDTLRTAFQSYRELFEGVLST
jgi:CRISPR/Cas system-associated endonuclease Cas1